MKSIRHKFLLAIFKWILFASSLVLFGNQLSTKFYVHSGRPVSTHMGTRKDPLGFIRGTHQNPIQNYKVRLSIDKRYLEPVIGGLAVSFLNLCSKGSQQVRQYGYLMQASVQRSALFEHLRGPPAYLSISL